MRACATALGLACGCFIALAWAQGLVIPDIRDPSLYRERPKSAESCRICGEVRSIREVQTEAPVSVAPNPARTTANNPNNWAVVGAAVYLPTGTGTAQSPHVGAVGTPEMVERFGSSTYEITIRMDTGENQVVQRRDGTRFRIGDRVTVSGGMMERL
jgi:outer membrane lipoprotein SlyB